MHPSVAQRLWRGRIGLWFGLCGCVQACSGPPSLLDAPDKQVAELPGQAGPTLTVAANDATTLAPVDAAPSPDGKRIYYLAVSNDGSDQPSAGVFAVDAAAEGNGAIDELTTGEPLLTPLGIDSSLDGRTLFIADTTAGADATGALFSLAAAGGAPAIVPGSEGYRPAGVVVSKQRGEEVLYFTGRDPESGAGAVFRIASSGGQAQRLASFDADSEPGGVAVANNGDLYIADHAGASARVLRVRSEQVTVYLTDIALGFPAGIALTSDSRTLLVSGLDPQTKHDVVYSVDLTTRKLGRVTQGISAYRESAGLHRAHDVNVFAWADSQAKRSGTVYTVKF
jgi:sugar lactone lactonase YvrE